MASIDDILTTHKNGVVAINGLNQTFKRSQGVSLSSTVNSQALIIAGKGYLVNFSVVVAGDDAGTIHNAATITLSSAANAMCGTPNIIGVYPCGQPFTNGLVVNPGTGQSLNVTYTLETT